MRFPFTNRVFPKLYKVGRVANKWLHNWKKNRVSKKKVPPLGSNHIFVFCYFLIIIVLFADSGWIPGTWSPQLKYKELKMGKFGVLFNSFSNCFHNSSYCTNMNEWHTAMDPGFPRSVCQLIGGEGSNILFDQTAWQLRNFGSGKCPLGP